MILFDGISFLFLIFLVLSSNLLENQKANYAYFLYAFNIFGESRVGFLNIKSKY